MKNMAIGYKNIGTTKYKRITNKDIDMFNQTRASEMKINKTVLPILLSVILAACGGSDSSSNKDADNNAGDSNEAVNQNQGDPSDSADNTEDNSKVTNNKLVILNQMTPTGLVKDGVVLTSIIGSNSVGDVDQEFLFEEPINYNESGVVYIPDDKCDVFWDLTPTSSDLPDMWPNSGVSFFVGCGDTLTCEATAPEFVGVTFGDLTCE